jgi:D-aspartate ligase
MTSPDRSVLDPRSRTGPAAVVIGLDSITGLQTARLLAARAVPVVGVAADRRHWGARTNACVQVVESALCGDLLVDSLLRLAETLGPRSVLFPCTDASVHTVSKARERLADSFALPLAEHPVVELLMDKVRFAEWAEIQGLPVPRTEVITSRADAQRAAAAIGYPCILKPPMKTATWSAHTSRKGIAVHRPSELLDVYDVVGGWSPVILAQEWVEGPETGLFSCNAYFGRGGDPLCTFISRKLRQWPPGIGTSASGEECRNDEVLITTLRLFRAAAFRGLAYLEMKQDVRTSRMMIIEPNVGRPTGRSAIAETGGVELLYTSYCDALGLPPPAGRTQGYGRAKWLDLRRDLQALAVGRQGWASFLEWLRWMRGRKAHAIWSMRDPVPFVVDVRQATTRAARRLLARLWSRLGPRATTVDSPTGAETSTREPTVEAVLEGHH